MQFLADGADCIKFDGTPCRYLCMMRDFMRIAKSESNHSTLRPIRRRQSAAASMARFRWPSGLSWGKSWRCDLSGGSRAWRRSSAPSSSNSIRSPAHRSDHFAELSPYWRLAAVHPRHLNPRKDFLPRNSFTRERERVPMIQILSVIRRQRNCLTSSSMSQNLVI